MRVFVYYNWREWVIQALTGPQSGKIIEHTPRVLLTDAEAYGGGFVGELSGVGDEAHQAAPLDREAYALVRRGGHYIYLGSVNQDFIAAPALYLSGDGQALALVEGKSA